MKLVKGGARTAPARAVAHLSLETKVLFTAVAGLCLIGLPIVLSASGPSAMIAGGSPWSYEIRQCMYMTIGVAAALIASRVPIALVRKLRFAAASCRFRAASSVVPGIGRYSGGCQPLGRIGPIQIQPSGLMKTRRRRACRRLVGSTGETVGSVERRRSSFARVHGLGGRADHQAARPRYRHRDRLHHVLDVVRRRRSAPDLVASAVTVFAIGAFLALSATYRHDRLLSFINPFAHASTTGSSCAVACHPRARWGDGERCRRVGNTLGVCPQRPHRLRLCCHRWQPGPCRCPDRPRRLRGLRMGGVPLAARETDPFARLVAVGITCWVLAQAVINVGGRCRRPSRDGHPSPVHLLRRVVSRPRARRRRGPFRDRPAPAASAPA